MSVFSVRGSAFVVAATLGLAPLLITSPAIAEPTVVFTESFEACTDPSGEPDYTDYPTAIHADDPILVDLWISEQINCPGWTAVGQAWMTIYSSGGTFPDGTHAMWMKRDKEHPYPVSYSTLMNNGMRYTGISSISKYGFADVREAIERSRAIVASRCAKVVAGAGSV